MDFAVIDDSQRNIRGIYVYTHVLVLGDDDVKDPLILVGDGVTVFNQLDPIYEYITSHLYPGCDLYACEHYIKYSKIWDMVRERANKNNRLSKRIREAFDLAHMYSSLASKKKLGELVSELS